MTISLTYDEKIAILDLGDDEKPFLAKLSRRHQRAP